MELQVNEDQTHRQNGHTLVKRNHSGKKGFALRAQRVASQLHRQKCVILNSSNNTLCKSLHMNDLLNNSYSKVGVSLVLISSAPADDKQLAGPKAISSKAHSFVFSLNTSIRVSLHPDIFKRLSCTCRFFCLFVFLLL